MDFKKNIAFTALVKIGGRLREFNFRKRGTSFYDVDTSDDRANRHFFKMEKSENSWKIISNDIASWLIDSETQINDAIQKEEQQISGL